MTPLSTTTTIPLKLDGDGVIRVSNTRVTLDTIVAAFTEGATPEEIAQQYPVVPLADIYHILGYFLQHTEEVENYLRAAEVQATQVRAENVRRFDPTGIRQRLLARRAVSD